MENSMLKKEPVISDDLLKLLTHHEISPNKVIFSARLDRNRDGVYTRKLYTFY